MIVSASTTWKGTLRSGRTLSSDQPDQVRDADLAPALGQVRGVVDPLRVVLDVAVGGGVGALRGDEDVVATAGVLGRRQRALDDEVGDPDGDDLVAARQRRQHVVELLARGVGGRDVELALVVDLAANGREAVRVALHPLGVGTPDRAVLERDVGVVVAVESLLEELADVSAGGESDRLVVDGQERSRHGSCSIEMPITGTCGPAAQTCSEESAASWYSRYPSTPCVLSDLTQSIAFCASPCESQLTSSAPAALAALCMPTVTRWLKVTLSPAETYPSLSPLPLPGSTGPNLTVSTATGALTSVAGFAVAPSPPSLLEPQPATASAAVANAAAHHRTPRIAHLSSRHPARESPGSHRRRGGAPPTKTYGHTYVRRYL